MKIANFADTAGSRWHIFQKNKETCLCGKHSKEKLNGRRIIRNNIQTLKEAQEKTGLGQLHQKCRRKVNTENG